jgi:hypothetical protein
MTDIERLTQLLRELPPAPPGWVEAAKELPQARAELDEIVARAEADAGFRRALLANLEAALAAEGYAPAPLVVEALRQHLASDAWHG